MAVHDLLDHSPQPDDLEVREAISGNLCRCTGYGRIFEAVDVVVRSRAARSFVVTDVAPGRAPVPAGR